jgi:hypothetical protein
MLPKQSRFTFGGAATPRIASYDNDFYVQGEKIIA